MLNIQNIKGKINVYEMENRVILFNCQNVQWIVLTYEEYDLYRSYLQYGSLVVNKEAEKLLMKLLKTKV